MILSNRCLERAKNANTYQGGRHTLCEHDGCGECSYPIASPTQSPRPQGTATETTTMNAPLPEHIRKALETVTLDDKYSLDYGRAFMSGVQALVKLPMLQRLRDK